MSIRLVTTADLQPLVGIYLDDYQLRDQVEIINEESPQVQATIDIIISPDGIQVPIDWFNLTPPFSFSRSIEFTKENLISLVFYYSGLHEDALNLSRDSELGRQIELFISGSATRQSVAEVFDQPLRCHNMAVLGLYADAQVVDTLESSFKKALEHAESDEQYAYSLLHYSIFLQDIGELEAAADLIDEAIQEKLLPEASRIALKSEWVRSILLLENHKLDDIDSIKDMMLDIRNFYSKSGATVLEAQILAEMSRVALRNNHFSEALTYLKKAEELYQAEQLPEMMANTNISMAMLLYQWAKQGAPQWYQEAIKSYQKALAVFKKEVAPDIFAEIHHQLGVIYAEMPAEQQKRAIWVAVSASSFKEALGYYTEQSFPYEYAKVCQNYGTALLNYPVSLRSDNIEKAIELFEKALSIRTKDLPEERALTLLNYLEACWEANNINSTMESVRIDHMRKAANEVIALSKKSDFVDSAENHLSELEKLSSQIAN